MAFDSVVFPESLLRNSTIGPEFKTDVVELDSGAEERVARWSQARLEIEARVSVAPDPLSGSDEFATLNSFFLARNGPANGFLVTNPMDYTSAADGRSTAAFDDVEIGIGDGSTTQFQLVKLYSTHTRTIEKPLASSVLIGLDGSAQGSGFSFSQNTGIVTFTAAPGNNVSVTAGFDYYVPMRFAEDKLTFQMVGGEVADVSARLIEIKNEAPVREELPAGGLVQETLASSRQISPAEAQTYLFTCNDTTHDVILPNPQGMGSGFYFYIANDSTATQALTILDHTGASLGSISAGATIRIGLLRDFGLFMWVAWG